MIEKYGDNYIFLLFIMNDNKNANGSGIKAIRYLKKIKDKIVKPLKSPLTKRIKEKKLEKKLEEKLSERRNINLKINTNIQYKGWD